MKSHAGNLKFLWEGMLKWQNNQEMSMNVFFVCFEASIAQECQKALLETKCHLLLVTQIAKPGEVKCQRFLNAYLLAQSRMVYVLGSISFSYLFTGKQLKSKYNFSNYLVESNTMDLASGSGKI